MKHNRRRSPGKPRVSPSLLDRINPNAAGLDCGSAEHFVAVPPDRDPSPVHEILEARGFKVLLVNARPIKNVPGRKSDVSDCEWLRELHTVGLLRGSFRPADAIVAWRAYLRHRQTLVESAGTYRPEHLFVLQQHLELFDACQTQLTACDGAIETHRQTLTAPREQPATLLPAPRVTKKPRDNEPRFEIRTPLHQLTGGVDLTQIDGIGSYTSPRSAPTWTAGPPRSTSPPGSRSPPRTRSPVAAS